MSSANTYARLKAEQNTREIAKALKAQNEAAERAERDRRASSNSSSAPSSASTDDPRLQWCVDRIVRLEAEVDRLRSELDAVRSRSSDES